MWSNLLDDEAPHREILIRIAASHPEAGIILPEYDRYEDYVEATASWGGATVNIYYETICSQILIWSKNREAVEGFRKVLLAHIQN